MSLSIRNQVPGTVTAVTSGPALTTVKVRLRGGQEVTAAITAEAVEELGIDAGAAVTVLVKSTEVALAIDRVEGLSIRNRLPGTVTEVIPGGAVACVKLSIEEGELTSVITQEAVADLRLVPGSPVVALVKSTEVALRAVP
ncbi:TOBE domain-containing protein [Streptomyces sp. TP-A0874]|uniref:TOBE domain-containing protein n=1 Tax=Streptomyces sp. TP-A0874 TaxID=549819 RepID=UPI0008535B9B|nr:TOBE domain-containing protein [Streptomyces sp. TP-A0874]